MAHTEVAVHGAVNGSTNGNGGLRRWLDKILIGAIMIVITLVAVVYGSLRSEIESTACEQRTATERSIRVEQHQVDMDKRLERIENKLDVALGLRLK